MFFWPLNSQAYVMFEAAVVGNIAGHALKTTWKWVRVVSNHSCSFQWSSSKRGFWRIIPSWLWLGQTGQYIPGPPLNHNALSPPLPAQILSCLLHILHAYCKPGLAITFEVEHNACASSKDCKPWVCSCTCKWSQKLPISLQQHNPMHAYLFQWDLLPSKYL